MRVVVKKETIYFSTDEMSAFEDVILILEDAFHKCESPIVKEDVATLLDAIGNFIYNDCELDESEDLPS